MAENLADGLTRELARNRELLETYKGIGAPGAFAAAFIAKDIKDAEQAMLDGDVVAMLAAFKKLEGHE